MQAQAVIRPPVHAPNSHNGILLQSSLVVLWAPQNAETTAQGHPPGVQPKPPSKFLQEATYCAALGTSSASSLLSSQQQDSAQ